jgi:tetratricopeptide (TPR) repeat protein
MSRPNRRKTRAAKGSIVAPRNSGRSKVERSRSGLSPHATGNRFLRISQSLRHGELVWGLLLAGATILFYQKAWHAGYVWDDDIYVTGNKLLTAPDGLRRIWFSFDSPSQYFPLVYTTFRFEHALWELNSSGYHWVNLLLHAANALLLWRLLRVLRVPGAWLAAAIFALHPVQVESVAWITERKNVLMGFFFLLSLLCWTDFVERKSEGKWRSYALALVFYALALFSKTTACTLPAALLLIQWLKGKRISWSYLAQIAPVVALGMGMGLVTIWWERYHQGTQGQLFAIGLWERVLVASRALWFYAGKLLWPAHLAFNYPRWTVSVARLSDFSWSAAILALGAAIVFARRTLGRGPEVATLFFVATLSPMLGFIMLYTFRYSFVADHYQYLASIGPIALAAAGITAGLDALKKRIRLFAQVLCGALLLLLGAKTWHQCAVYTDLDTLWKATISENPDSWMAYNNLGLRLVRAGRFDEGIADYKKALEINPRFAEAYYNLGNALTRTGKPVEEAASAYKQALEIEPRMAAAYSNLGTIFLSAGRGEESIAYFTKALQLEPGNAATHNQLGDALFRAGRLEESIAHYRTAVQLDPNDVTIFRDLGRTLAQAGRTDEAIAVFGRIVELNPKAAPSHYNLANVLLQAGRNEEAIDQFNQAVEINPTYAAAYNNLGNVLVQLGRMEEALSHYYRALEINPNYSAAHHNLGKALQRMNRQDEAVLHLQRALELDPGLGAGAQPPR